MILAWAYSKHLLALGAGCSKLACLLLSGTFTLISIFKAALSRATTFSIMTIGIMALGIMTHSMQLNKRDTQHQRYTA
jgi:hypothetical protein